MPTSRFARLTDSAEAHTNRSKILGWSYRLWAPIYDPLIGGRFHESRRRSLAALGDVDGQSILIDGIGTGLDIPLLPKGANYIGLDLSLSMLRRAVRKAHAHTLPMRFHVGDVMALPYRDGVFDALVLHLILAVVPDARAALEEAARVVKPGGRLHILDKFLHPGQLAPVRRLAGPLLGLVVTRTDVVFEEFLAACPGLRVISDEPDVFGGWFRRIVLEKSGSE